MSRSATAVTAAPHPPRWDEGPEGLPSWVARMEADVVVVPQPWIVPRMDDEQLIAALAEAEAAGRRVDALRAALAAEAAERSRRELGGGCLCRRLGCRSVVELIQRLTGVSARTVNRRVRLGAAIRPGQGLTGESLPPRFPVLARAVEQGLLGVDAGGAVVDVLAPAVRVAGLAAVQVAEDAIVAEAAGDLHEDAPRADADAVRMQALVWRAVLDPDGAAPREVDVERRCLSFGAPRHGLVPVRGLLLPEVAAGMERYADAWANPRSVALPQPGGLPQHGAAQVPGDGVRADEGVRRDDEARPDEETLASSRDAHVPMVEPDPVVPVAAGRSRAQLFHDVLATAVSVAARSVDAPSVAGNAPTLVVTVTQAELVAGRGVAWSEGRPVSLAAARHAGCAGAVETVVTGSNGRLVGLGSRERCFTGQQRRAIAVRDGTCVIPGCHVPAGWCEVHHVVPHATDPDGTHTDNGVLLCWFHHRTLEASGWEVRMRSGVPEVRPPRWLDPERRWRPPERPVTTSAPTTRPAHGRAPLRGG